MCPPGGIPLKHLISLTNSQCLVKGVASQEYSELEDGCYLLFEKKIPKRLFICPHGITLFWFQVELFWGPCRPSVERVLHGTHNDSTCNQKCFFNDPPKGTAEEPFKFLDGTFFSKSVVLKQSGVGVFLCLMFSIWKTKLTLYSQLKSDLSASQMALYYIFSALIERLIEGLHCYMKIS